MTNPDRIDIEGLAAQLVAATPDLDPAEQQGALTLLRLLAQGEPVEVEDLSEALALPAAQLEEMFDCWPGVFRDEHRRIVGIGGLTILEMGDHRIHVHGRSLSAWCAWDTLFLPELLGEAARVTSRCPSTGAEISLTVTPAGPADLAPPEAVISFLAPDTRFDANVIESFCHFVHFFASPDSAATWTAEHPGTFLLSVDEGYRLGQLTNRAMFGAVLAA
jgi:alkylmercury lyase